MGPSSPEGCFVLSLPLMGVGGGGVAGGDGFNGGTRGGGVGPELLPGQV